MGIYRNLLVPHLDNVDVLDHVLHASVISPWVNTIEGKRLTPSRSSISPSISPPHPVREMARTDQEGLGSRPAALPHMLTGNADRRAYRRPDRDRAHLAASGPVGTVRAGVSLQGHLRNRPNGSLDPPWMTHFPTTTPNPSTCLPKLRRRRMA